MAWCQKCAAWGRKCAAWCRKCAALYLIHYTLYTIQYTIHYILYTIHYTIYANQYLKMLLNKMLTAGLLSADWICLPQLGYLYAKTPPKNIAIFYGPIFEYILGCSIPNTWMEFGQGWPFTGCLLTPLVCIQNPGPEKFQEVRERGLATGRFF